MGFIQRHLNFGSIMATIALFVALGGTSYAVAQLPANSVGTKQLRSGAVTLTKIKKRTRTALKGQRGVRGLQGAKGDKGDKGDAGAAGSNATVNGVAAGGDLTGTYPNPTVANGAITAAKLAPTPAFQDLTLENGWVKFFAISPTSYNTPGYTKDALGFVHLRGALGGLSRTSIVFAHLPAGFRPAGGQFTWLPVANTNADSTPRPVAISIDNTDGTMNAEAGGDWNFAFLSLEGVTFYAGP